MKIRIARVQPDVDRAVSRYVDNVSMDIIQVAYHQPLSLLLPRRLTHPSDLLV